MCPGTDSIAFHLWSFLRMIWRSENVQLELLYLSWFQMVCCPSDHLQYEQLWCSNIFFFLISIILYILSAIEISLNLNTGESQLLLIKRTLRILLKDKNVDRLKDSVILRDEGLKNICGSPELCSSFSVVLQPFPTAMIMLPSGLRK